MWRTHSFVPSASLDREADQVSHNELTMFLLCRQCVGCWQRQPGQKLCLAPIAHGSATAQLWKAFPSGLRLISSRSISSKMCLHPPQRHAQCGHLGTCVPGTGTAHLLMCLHILSCGWGKEMDGKGSVISMWNRAMPGRWSMIF